ncbi:addiction module toxin component, YafQ family [Helicobacter pylori GAMchJs117Ai]|uniref:YafQ family addiction module toxin n=1 Tax=Helicobacter pylori TaxID=210 RepID=UPI0002BDBA57|nr:YafQ family addiction module toxin [Helicobacter pylori]EMJ39278.1 addiction module toxin component, YafQ family [Helicobacter pylori GAMchJs117Ai]
MLTIETSKKFDKDLKILVKNGFDLKLLYKVVGNLATEQPLAPKYKDHPLKGDLKDFRECHLKPDLLLVCQIKKQENILVQVYKAINKLSQIECFKKSVRDTRAFKVEGFSGFT